MEKRWEGKDLYIYHASISFYNLSFLTDAFVPIGNIILNTWGLKALLRGPTVATRWSSGLYQRLSDLTAHYCVRMILIHSTPNLNDSPITSHVSLDNYTWIRTFMSCFLANERLFDSNWTITLCVNRSNGFSVFRNKSFVAVEWWYKICWVFLGS